MNEATPKQSVKVSIMQREFTIACSTDESDSLIEAAAYLDKQMRTIAKGNQILGIDRCAIMAGLNIAHELLELEKRVNQQADTDDRLKSLHDQVDKTVEKIKQVAKN